MAYITTGFWSSVYLSIGFYNIVEVIKVPSTVQCKPMEKSLTFRIFIKSAVYQINVKLGAWVISIVQD